MNSIKRFTKTFLAVAMGASFLMQPLVFPTAAHAQDANQPLNFKGLSRQPSEAANKVLFNANDAVLLLIDHQTGLFQTVNDVPLAELRANAVALAKIAQLAGMPIIYTASEPNGPNGPIMEELPKAAPMQFVPRKGEVSAWDNADFVKAVEATGRKTLVIAGVWTSVCVAFPALEATADGYKVYAVMDASGDVSKMASDAAELRMTRAGVTTLTTNTMLSETHRTWNRPDALKWLDLYSRVVPEYRAGVENYNAAQKGASKSESGQSTQQK